MECVTPRIGYKRFFRMVVEYETPKISYGEDKRSYWYWRFVKCDTPSPRFSSDVEKRSTRRVDVLYEAPKNQPLRGQ